VSVISDAEYIEAQQMLFDMRNTGFVYFVDCPRWEVTKVGWAKNVARRMYALQTSCPFDLVLKDHFPGDKLHESDFHIALDDHRLRGEWFKTLAVHQLLAELEAIKAERNRPIRSMEAMEVWKRRNYTTASGERYVEYTF